MVKFIRGEMQRRIQDSFFILLHDADTLQMFGAKLKISCIAAVPQENCRMHLIINLSEKLDE